MKRQALPSGLMLGLGALLWAVAAVLISKRTALPQGVDLRPTWQAGRAVLDGSPLYHVRDFVYPPFAAVAALPLAAFSFASVLAFWGWLQVLVPVGVVAYAAAWKCRWQVGFLLAGLGAVLLLKADVFVDSLGVANPTVLFIAPTLLVPMLWASGHWRTGAVVLGVAIAIKPLLLLALLIPLVMRRSSVAVTAAATALALTLIGALVSHDLSGLIHLPHRILSGTNLHGSQAVFNVSLAGVAEVHPHWRIATQLLRLVVLAAVVLAAFRLRTCPADALTLVAAVGLCAAALSVAGSISEVHYALLPIPALIVGLRLSTSWPVRFLLLCALMVAVVPLASLPGSLSVNYRDDQIRWCLTQLIAVGALLAVLFSRGDRSTDLGLA